MKYLRLAFIITGLLLLFPVNCIQAQEPGAKDVKRPVRTPEQIAAEQKAREELMKND